MTDGQQEPGTGVKVHDGEAAAMRYDEASPQNKEAAWLELWHARDFTWHGRSEIAVLQTEMVEVPASFPDGREPEGEFKTVCLKDYWRWSVGLEGEERLLTDEEMREAGLLVEVEGETYHLIHAPDMGLKADEHGAPLRVLKDIVAARGKRVPEDIGTDGNGQPNFARSLQLRGSWLHGDVLRHAGTETALLLSGARISDVNLRGLKFGPLNCVQSLFVGEADFRSATFSGAATFWRATFSGAVNFERATFSGEATFRNAAFSGEATFWRATFSGVAGFGYATFSSVATFRSATFSGAATFWRATFSGAVNFERATFSGEATFRNATFSGEATFWRATFSGMAGFGYATFSSAATFRSATFSGEASFESATFSGEATFRSATFSGAATFWRATFSGVAGFDGATFSGVAKFWHATFSGEASFESATFSGEADFGMANFKNFLTFEDGTFESVVTFRDVNWSKTNSPNAFRGARFKDRTDFKSSFVPSISSFNEVHFALEPSFTDPTQSQIDEIFRKAIEQTNASIDEALENKPKARGREKKAIQDDLLNALEGGFRTLKKVAEKKGNFLLAQTYYRFEVKTRVRRPSIPFWEKVAAGFYGLSSDYGNSIARPFVSLAFILAGFAAIYLALAIEVNLVDWQDRQALQNGFLESLDFALENVFRPLSALSTEAPRDGDATSWAGKLLNNYGKGFGLIVTAISIVQSLTGIVLAFLFGLAVRRRFQIS